MPIKPVARGASLPQWTPDEVAFATSLDARERKYGGDYTETNISFSQNQPTLTFMTAPFAYGDEDSVYGWIYYDGADQSSTVSVSIDFSDVTVQNVGSGYYGGDSEYGTYIAP